MKTVLIDVRVQVLNSKAFDINEDSKRNLDSYFKYDSSVVQRRSRTIATGRRPNGALTGNPIQDERLERRRQSNRAARQRCEAKRTTETEMLEQKATRLSEANRLLKNEIEIKTQRKQDLERVWLRLNENCAINPVQSGGGSNYIQSRTDGDANVNQERSHLVNEIHPRVSDESSNGLSSESIDDIIRKNSDAKSTVKFKFPREFETFLRQNPINAGNLFSHDQEQLS